MTELEFRKNPKLVKAASRLTEDPTFRAVMGVVWSEHPMFLKMAPSGGVGNSTDYQLGTVDGANRVIRVLLNLGQPLTEGIELQAKFQPPEE